MDKQPSSTSSSNRLRWFLSSVVMASIILPALILTTYSTVNRFQTTINERTRADAQALMEVLKEGLTPPLWSFIPDNAEHLINGVALNDAVNRITVLDVLDEVFVEKYRTGYEPGAEAVTLTDDVIREDRKIGSIELEYSLEPARRQAWQETRNVLLITLAQVLFSLTAILVVLKVRVTDPLTRIKSFAHEVAAKNFDVEIQAKHDDEISDIANELDSMRHALRESFENLEDRVKQRTEDLTRVNNELTETVITLEETRDNLVQTEKLAALGSLVAGVSHELNTPIGNGRVMTTALHQTTIELKKRFEKGEMSRSQFESTLEELIQGTNLIERNLIKAIDLVESFKQIAVDRTSDKRRHFMINDFLQEIESTLHHIFKANPHTLSFELDKDVELNSFPGVLSQVISNLINNALMHGLDGIEAGSITVKTQVRKHQVQIDVQDNGIGMEDGVKNRIFEPFFTTKLGKGGSGLGMHIVHNLVTGPLGGQLSVVSRPGKGTTVVINIPLLAPENQSEAVISEQL